MSPSRGQEELMRTPNKVANAKLLTGRATLWGAWDGAHTWEVGGRLQMQRGLGEREWKVLAPTFAGTSWTSTLESSFPDGLWLLPSLPHCIFSIVTAHVL